MKLQGRFIEAVKNFFTNKIRITLEIDSNIINLDEIQNVELLDIEIKKHRKKRSLDANAYCWLLLGKLAEKMNLKVNEVYRMEIREVGAYTIVCTSNESKDLFIDKWQSNGIGWVCDTFDSKIDGCTNIRAYYGSSTYDSKEMSRLIDSIVEDCKLQGIPTDTPEQIARYKEAWK